MLFKDKSRCEPYQKIITSSENKKTHKLYNDNLNEIYQFKVDGDIVTDDSIRCDYIVENATNKILYIIELKGSDLKHAVEQIEATINRFSTSIRNYCLYPRIVCKSNTHKIEDSLIIRFKKKYANKYIIQNPIIEEHI